jgi:hypothetical protein
LDGDTYVEQGIFVDSLFKLIGCEALGQNSFPDPAEIKFTPCAITNSSSTASLHGLDEVVDLTARRVIDSAVLIGIQTGLADFGKAESFVNVFRDDLFGES